MRLFRSIQATAAVLACASWLFPLPTAAANAPATGPGVSAPVRDVALGPRGRLQGRIVDPQGHALAGRTLVVQQADAPARQIVTDAQGRFAVEHLRGGVCQIAGPGLAAVCRCWTIGAAPPAANAELLIVSQETTLRGQQPIQSLCTPILVGAVIAAAIVIPIVVHNSHKDNSSGS